MKVTIPPSANLPEGLILELPTLVIGVQGPPGTGKSEFMSTLPPPIKVIATDPMAKMRPYFDRGVVSAPLKGPAGNPMRRVMDAKDATKLLIEIEGFYDFDPAMPMAMQNLMTCAERTQRECMEGKWGSVVLDSYSGMEDIARFRRETGPFSVSATQNNNDGRAVYNSAKQDSLQVLLMRLVHLDNFGVTVGITLHTTAKMEEAAGKMLYGIKAIGDSGTTIGRNIAERYRSEACADGVTRQLVTRPDGRFDLTTMIEAPSPCKNAYPALFTVWINKQVAKKVAQLATTEPTKASE